MAPLTRAAQRAPLTVFFALACAFTWALLPFARASTAASLLALCGPAAAALATASLAGPEHRRDLVARVSRWRVPARWYALALALPPPISAAASAFEWLWGAPGPIRPLPISVLGAVVFVLVAGEEIGWRGFALPRLLERFGPWTASAILGALWALWHLPLFSMPSMPQSGAPFLPFVGYTVALSVLLTALAAHTRGSVVIATLFHGAVNTFGLINEGASATQRGWGNALAYGLAAVIVAIFTARSSARRR